MSTFAAKYKSFVEQADSCDRYFGFDIKAIARIEPVLKFLHHHWWKVQSEGFDQVPAAGAAMIVGNASGVLPWVALMLIYTLMCLPKNCRRVHIVANMDWVEDERLLSMMSAIGFVPWSSDNVKSLLEKGELVAVFPEGINSVGKSLSMKNRVGEFDWTRFLPAIEHGTKIFPLATLGCDESFATFFNLSSLAKSLKLACFPVSPFFPWLPFPLNLASWPITWKMCLMPAIEYKAGTNRQDIQECAKKQTLYAEGEIQAELNRLLRARHRRG